MNWIVPFFIFSITYGAKSEHASVIEESNLLPTFDLPKPVLSSPPPHNKYRGGPFKAIYTNHGDLNSNPADDPGEPLFLTPYLQKGKIKEAKSLSRVQLGHRYGHSYSGLITVNDIYKSNMFFWFFPSRYQPSNDAVIVWLQGGPGGSSLFGLFAENGPLSIDKNLHIHHRPTSWNGNFSVLYIDNPVGTGFSFTENDKGYATNEADVGKDLYNFMFQFYQLFPELQKNDLYITGESYGGKYVPALAYTIYKMNKNSKFHMNLKGLAIGNGFSDPISMTDYADHLYQIGLIDTHSQKYFAEQAQKTVDLIKQKKWIEAAMIFDKLLNGDMHDSYFTNVTGLSNYYNYLLEKTPKDMDYWSDFINQAKVRREIHVGNLTFHSGEKVEKFLQADMMKSVKPWIETLMDNYAVMFYNGQLDIICGAALTDNFIKTLNWKYADEFKKAPRRIWKVEGEIAGYYTFAHKFIQVVVRDAGHMVPYDQPKWTLDLIRRFVHDSKDFSQN